jgi:hypothetical protein
VTRRRRQLVTGIAILTLAATGAALLATRSSDGANATKTTSPLLVRSALISRLETEHLTYRWVVCVPTGRAFRRQGVVRCNVNFGDPHIEAYCAIVDRGRLLTDHETPSFDCPPDLRGWTTTIVTGP